MSVSGAYGLERTTSNALPSATLPVTLQATGIDPSGTTSHAGSPVAGRNVRLPAYEVPAYPCRVRALLPFTVTLATLAALSSSDAFVPLTCWSPPTPRPITWTSPDVPPLIMHGPALTVTVP